MPTTLTPQQQLSNRIMREFRGKIFIGDISISDDEYDLLLNHLRLSFRAICHMSSHSAIDPVLCVALVQIGIRCYDGSYWVHVQRALGYDGFTVKHQTWLGESFIKTVQKYEKKILAVNERVDSILMHGFVPNYYADKFFDYLFAFYHIDLDRDIQRLDRDSMRALIDSIKSNDKCNRTYMLVEPIADATRVNTRGCRTRIRRYLKLIDHAFWDDVLPTNSPNRLTQRLVAWTEASDKYSKDKNCNGSTARRGMKHFACPYLRCDSANRTFEITIPSQLVSFDDAQDLFWSITAGDAHTRIDTNPCQQGISGYKTDEESVPLDVDDLFGAIQVDLMSGEKRIKHFIICKENIRFFDKDGYHVKQKSLVVGSLIAFSRSDVVPHSQAMTGSACDAGLRRSFFDFEDGDIVILPGEATIYVGQRIQEGLRPRGMVRGASADIKEDPAPVFSVPPMLVFKTIPSKLPGTAITVNGRKMRFHDGERLVDGIEQFNLNDRSAESGYQVNLGKFGCCSDGTYEVVIDVPNDRTNRRCQFVLIHGMSFYFEDAPYIFKTRGTLCVPNGIGFTSRSTGSCETDHDFCAFDFDIVAGESTVNLQWFDVNINFEVPALSYRFADEAWQIEPHVEVWHTAFQPKLLVKYCGEKLSFMLDEGYYDTDDEDFDHAAQFSKTKNKDVFDCDLGRFRSWFGIDATRRQLYLSLPDVEKPIPFLTVVTRSELVSGMLHGDFINGRLLGEFKIIGQAEYYVDIIRDDQILVEKRKLLNGTFDVNSDLRSGLYKARIFESEDDDSGFGESVFCEIGSKELELINPQDLTGKKFNILGVSSTDESNRCYLPLDCAYHVRGLRRAFDGDLHHYQGEMRVESYSGRILAAFDVNVTFYNLDNLRKVYLTFDDDDEFLYDEYKHAIVKEEEAGLKKSLAYRRYKISLYPEDYVYEIEFPFAEREKCNAISASAPCPIISPTAKPDHVSPPPSPPVKHVPIITASVAPPMEPLEAGLSKLTLNCLRRAGIRTQCDLLKLIQEKGTKSLYNINRLNASMRKEVISFIEEARTSSSKE